MSVSEFKILIYSHKKKNKILMLNIADFRKYFLYRKYFWE